MIIDVVPPLPDQTDHDDEREGLLTILRRRTEAPRPLDDDERARVAAALTTMLAASSLPSSVANAVRGCARRCSSGLACRPTPRCSRQSSRATTRQRSSATLSRPCGPTSKASTAAAGRELARLPPRSLDGTGFRSRATHLDGKRTPTVVFCDDARIPPGTPCQVRIT